MRTVEKRGIDKVGEELRAQAASSRSPATGAHMA